MKWVLCIFGALGLVLPFLIMNRLPTPPLPEVQVVFTGCILFVLVIIALTLLRLEARK
jgi:hypothetical protein